ncbi:Protein of unknown function [Spirosomataceae bacterium TFI 002]|nr:Protein of unknown function [Spirosomataceae bacterium TFI 002]
MNSQSRFVNILLVAIFAVFTLNSCAQKINLGKILDAATGSSGALSEGEVANGLKEALTIGISKGADLVSKENGYLNNPKIRIPFPPDVQRVENTLRSVGLGNQVDKFIESLNHGAEEAAKEAKPIFIAAIKQMSINDAFSILKGEQDAATMFLKRTTTAQLTEKFMPVVEKALAKTQATQYYGDIANAYNKIPLTSNINPDLKGYATEMAINGLFLMIAEEEAKIRQDPFARTSALLKRVFGNS